MYMQLSYALPFLATGDTAKELAICSPHYSTYTTEELCPEEVAVGIWSIAEPGSFVSVKSEGALTW